MTQQTHTETDTATPPSLEKQSLIANILPVSDDRVIQLQIVFIFTEFAVAAACGWLFFDQSVITPTFQNLLLIVMPLILMYTANNRYELIQDYRAARNSNNNGESL